MGLFFLLFLILRKSENTSILFSFPESGSEEAEDDKSISESLS